MKMASDINFCQEQATWKKSYPSATQLFLFVCMHTRVHVHVWVHVRVSVGGSGSQGTTPEVILKAWTPCFWDGGIIIVEFAKARLASQWVSGLHLLLLPQQWNYKRVASCYLRAQGVEFRFSCLYNTRFTDWAISPTHCFLKKMEC